MKKQILYITVLLCSCLPVSCLTSLQPLVTKHNVVTENRVTGTWQSNNDLITISSMAQDTLANDLNPFLTRSPFDKSELDSAFFSKFYHIHYRKQGVDYHMAGALSRIHGNLFVQLQPAAIQDPEKPEASGYEMPYDYLPSFTIAKLQINNGSLTIHFLDGDYIKEQINSGHIRIKHEKDDLFGTFLITASSAELQQFLEKYGNDQRLYGTKNSVTLIRKGSI